MVVEKKKSTRTIGNIFFATLKFFSKLNFQLVRQAA